MGFTVAIVGRPNVGKSTLFNRLAGRRRAIVHDRPGVTRDRREGEGAIADLRFKLVDTAGMEQAFDDSLAGRMRAQTERAIAAADAVLFLIDAREGILPAEADFARHLRRRARKVVLVANKCEGRAGLPGLIEAHALGLGDLVAISAEHGEGMGELYDALLPLARAAGWTPPPEEEGATEQSAADTDESGPIDIAIVGRPNVGKSTLVNRLLGEERMLTGPEPGVTRDAIRAEWIYKGRRVRLVDTAGLRRRARVIDAVEKLAAADALDAIRLAQVVVLVVEAGAILDKQDLAIADHVAEEGRALVIAVNKWDAVRDRAAELGRLRDRLETSLPQLRGLATVTVSARKGQGMDALMNAVLRAYALWNHRIPTAELNRWLEGATERHPPPATMGGGRVRLRYATQAKTRPPTIAIFTQRAAELPDSYARYLVNDLRESFDLPGVPIRLALRKRANPFAGEETPRAKRSGERRRTGR